MSRYDPQERQAFRQALSSLLESLQNVGDLKHIHVDSEIVKDTVWYLEQGLSNQGEYTQPLIVLNMMVGNWKKLQARLAECVDDMFTL